MLPKFIPIDGQRMRDQMKANDDGTMAAARECFGSMDLGRMQMTSLLKGNCLRTMNNYFESVNIFKNRFVHQQIIIDGTERLMDLVSAFGTEDFVTSLNAFRDFQAKISEQQLSNMCNIISNDMLPCIIDSFAPLLLKKFVSKSCCDGLRRETQEKLGQLLDMNLVRRITTAANEIMCSRRVADDSSQSVCVYQIVQALVHDNYASDLVATCSAAEEKDLCALNNGKSFQMINGTSYQTTRSIGCCADRLDYHIKKAVEDYPVLKTELTKRFLVQDDSMTMQELPGMDKLIELAGWGQDQSFHIPLGFSASCSYDSTCESPN